MLNKFSNWFFCSEETLLHLFVFFVVGVVAGSIAGVLAFSIVYYLFTLVGF